ncbi:unnamed protein product [Nyctereutes procyonoides]|uniref:(raccoon dog) hypothetical protein n=1 Tax=Nyctereutes procyonoides TaxID=34880 RepID=A0A811YTB7_NYCPR|nr:unnamed protein product [Nyctereutes procyonoides]
MCLLHPVARVRGSVFCTRGRCSRDTHGPAARITWLHSHKNSLLPVPFCSKGWGCVSISVVILSWKHFHDPQNLCTHSHILLHFPCGINQHFTPYEILWTSKRSRRGKGLQEPVHPETLLAGSWRRSQVSASCEGERRGSHWTPVPHSQLRVLQTPSRCSPVDCPVPGHRCNQDSEPHQPRPLLGSDKNESRPTQKPLPKVEEEEVGLLGFLSDKRSADPCGSDLRLRSAGRRVCGALLQPAVRRDQASGHHLSYEVILEAPGNWGRRLLANWL